jgi:hypothetical protein
MRRVAVGVPGVGGFQYWKALWYVSFASAKRSEVWSAIASFRRTSAISWSAPRRSSSGSSAR